jgi:hypothetical protein
MTSGALAEDGIEMLDLDWNQSFTV